MQEESHYVASNDVNGNPLEGSRKYKLHLPPNIPASEFWSVLVYDDRTRLIIRNDQPWPSVHSRSDKLVYNQDGSVDINFGPGLLPASENWIRTIPGVNWYMVLRLYLPLEPWFDKSWQPGGIEEMK